MITPRSYQIEAALSIWNYFTKKSGNPLVVMPTGTGKSIVIALFLYWVYQQFFSSRVIILAHVKELVEQNHAKLQMIWPNCPAGIYSAGLNSKDLYSPIIFAGIASIFKLAVKLGHVDLLIVDEAHTISPKEKTMYMKFINELLAINPNLKVIGFTATDYRMGHGKITENDGIFTDVCFDISGMVCFNRLIAEGYLCTMIPMRTRLQLNVDGVHIRGGEYLLSELQEAVDRDDITEKALREAMEVGSDRKCWLIFCAGVEHAINAARILTQLGIKCEAIHSELHPTERDRIIKDLKEGRLMAVSNNNVLTTGFDHPPIDLIIMLRPTKSTVLWVQMLGRGTRPWPGKENCMVLDYSGNTKRLGPINDPVVPAKKGQKTGPAPVKECTACGCWNHASVVACIKCSAEFLFAGTKLKYSASTIDIVKGEEPITKVFKVDHITYSVHQKLDRVSMKVTYYCGLQHFPEFVCFEHEGFAQRKARMWWRDRSDMEVPTTVESALQVANMVLTPTHIRVWINKKYPEIMKFCFDGTAFGTHERDDKPPTVQTQRANVARIATQDSVEEDDIPF